MPAVIQRSLDGGAPRRGAGLGGIPRGDSTLIVGAQASSKTTLVCQFALHAESLGQDVLFVSTSRGPASRLVKHLRALSFWDEALLTDENKYGAQAVSAARKPE